MKSYDADPYSTSQNCYYFYTNTERYKLVPGKSNNPAYTGNAENNIVWTSLVGTDCSHEIWAPKINYIDGKLYFILQRTSEKMIPIECTYWKIPPMIPLMTIVNLKEK